MEKWTEADQTIVSSGKQTVVSWEKSGGYSSSYLSFYSSSRNWCWDGSLFKTCTASKE